MGKEILCAELKNLFKNRKGIVTIISILFVLYLISVNFPTFYNIFIKNLRNVRSYWVNNYIVFSFLIVNILVTWALLRKSNNEFKLLQKEHYPDDSIYKSKEDYPISTKITLRNTNIDNKYVVERQVDIQSTLGEKIQNIKGVVEFYKDRILIDDIKFDVNYLEPNRGIRIADDIISFKDRDWDEFKTRLQEATSVNQIFKNHEIFGTKFRKTHFLLLNRYKYIRLGKFNLPYEISWLKEKILMDIVPYYNYHFGLKRFRRRKSFIDLFKEIIINMLLLLYLLLVIWGLFKMLKLVWIFLNIIIATSIEVYNK